MKTHSVKVVHNGEIILEESRQGGNKAKSRKYLLNLVEDVDGLLEPKQLAYLLFQYEGAKTWAAYSYVVGDNEIIQVKATEVFNSLK